ncbi:UNVERIFIED_CONTAM: hypothetical protein FKN15_046131 [Acipenser sinensis]
MLRLVTLITAGTGKTEHLLDTAGTAIGFNVETVTYKNLKFQVWDLGGQTSIRPYWRCYYSNTDAIIYVVDSCDRDRMGISKSELVAMLEEEELKKAILVVFANKQDMEQAMTPTEVANSLGLSALKDRKWQIFKTSATKGTGLDEAMEWPYWRCYYSNTDAIIYVVDSCDRDRMGISKSELVAMLEEEELKKAILVVFANKQDMEQAMTPTEVANSLGLPALKDRKWQIFKTSATKGTGLDEAMEWYAA